MAKLYVGDTYNITATIIDADLVKVEVSYDNKETWELIETEIVTEHETVGDQEVYEPFVYPWLVVGEGTECFFRVSGLDGDVDITDASDESFEIEVRILTSITVSPSSKRVLIETQATFTAIAYDQTQTALDTQPEFVWSTDSVHGSINQQGIFTAGDTAEECTVTATSGSISGVASIVVLTEFSKRKNNSSLNVGISLSL